ncbi:MAG: acetyltransferase, N-acetylglutamate synthase [Herbinix sp.]|jgi:ribosomal protein S18 acetylase RimI-like enzyme|nr:acetyltransferase, N-acetylglutamate synthase [Herbinix sp.]
MNIEIRLAYEEQDKIGELFQEYISLLIEKDPSIIEYLTQQNYEAELEHLEHKYGLPNGRLYIAYIEHVPVGCVGLRPIDHTTCEVKRLYVRPEFRGQRIGIRLMDQLVLDAKEIGYQYMVLDTLPYLTNAIAMYKNYGFYEIPPYNNSPMTYSIFMRFDLSDQLTPC